MIGAHHVLVVLAVVAIIGQFARQTLATGTANTGKFGSSFNSFLEWPAALCLCAGVGWDTVRRLVPRRAASRP